MPMQDARIHRERIWRLTAWGGVIPGPGEAAEKTQMAGLADA